MFTLKYYDKKNTFDNSILDKYINIMDMYDRGVIFFDLIKNAAYFNEKCGNVFDTYSDMSKIEKFIDDIEKDFYKDDEKNKEVKLTDLEDSITYTIKHLTEEKKIKYILCTVEKKANAGNSKERKYLSRIIGESDVMLNLKEKVKIVGRYDSTILLLGQTGTGKELFAKAIHDISPRRNKKFIVVNCGAIPDSLLESELFGYEKGAFTGANSNGKVGKFEEADGGTIFLDEIENMSQFMQNKILRAIEDRKICKIGSNKEVGVNVRIIGATNIELKKMVEEGKFRKDLYYRLNVICFKIPSLIERKDDIFLISDYLIEKYCKVFKKNIIGLSPKVKKLFNIHKWEGNVRELRNVIEYAMNFENSKYITEASLPNEFIGENEVRIKPEGIVPIEEMEKEVLRKTLDWFGWDEAGKIRVAEALGISRSSVYRKIAKYHLEPPDMINIS
ncbi:MULTISPECIES: sigma-54 interaction domain-containing protein [Clostridium]|uniref:Predicted transcriptional regulator n=5 Tax=Clostridium TaxID=1485 RepID=D8GJV1_CLOLD|nr:MULTISPECIES: sigma 54-interacting transcriptional regulator [Clostridium]ADK17253.1 predicted transcriptional regulator [Clostridium ljungdahlii DSM 13528]AGY76295.1 sigma 54-interacting transcriptional regulator [Clostridium autoethanogenum DSM 10061]ALU36455.1 Sigma-54 specific transcriptional regulator Fis family [Clostridium autoethanogenum DSM 10061]OVY48973.1 Transcriptional regulatory protein ZraR [Clostridium autoethanogenum]